MPLGANAPRAGLAVASKLGVLLSATGFLDHKLSLHLGMCIHNLKLYIFHIAKPGLNAAKPGTVSHDEPEKVKAVI